MFNLSAIKLLIIIFVVVIFLGPDKLPEAAQKVGRFWSLFRSWQRRLESEVREVIPNLPSSDSLGKYVRKPSSILDQLADKSNATTDEGPEFVARPKPPASNRPATDSQSDPGLN